jgi:hypothetical protein
MAAVPGKLIEFVNDIMFVDENSVLDLWLLEVRHSIRSRCSNASEYVAIVVIFRVGMKWKGE